MSAGDLHKNTQAEEIDNQVQLKYFFAGTKTCVLGSPRIQLAIDRDGDGDRDGNAFGYLGDKPFGGLCPPNAWTLEDMTNAQQKWDLSQLGGGMTLSWDQMEVFLRTTNPNYQILRGTLVEDPGVGPGSSGITYFDNIVIGNRDDQPITPTPRVTSPRSRLEAARALGPGRPSRMPSRRLAAIDDSRGG